MYRRYFSISWPSRWTKASNPRLHGYEKPCHSPCARLVQAAQLQIDLELKNRRRPSDRLSAHQKHYNVPTLRHLHHWTLGCTVTFHNNNRDPHCHPLAFILRRCLLTLHPRRALLLSNLSINSGGQYNNNSSSSSSSKISKINDSSNKNNDLTFSRSCRMSYIQETFQISLQ